MQLLSLEFVRDFMQKLIELFPERSQLPAAPPNEFGVEVFYCFVLLLVGTGPLCMHLANIGFVCAQKVACSYLRPCKTGLVEVRESTQRMRTQSI